MNQSAGSMQGFTDGAFGANGFVGRTTTGFAGNRSASNAINGAGGAGLGGNAQGRNSLGGGRGGQAGFGRQSFARSNRNFGRDDDNRNFGSIGQGMNGLGAASRVVRPQQRIAFPYNPRPVEQVHTSLQTTLTKLPDERFQTMTMQINSSGVLTLRGTVASEDDRKLAEALARLEPGVRDVTNEITVQPK
jgi:hypothetical protein